MAPLTVVFVCTGNTCRSPLAMALARREWPADVVFHSAGLQAVPGQPATEAARLVAAERGSDLATHRAQPLDGPLVAAADWLIGMTRSHVGQLNARLGERDDVRVGLLGWPSVDLRGAPAPVAEEVADPFGDTLDCYRATADQIERLLRPWQAVLRGESSETGGVA